MKQGTKRTRTGNNANQSTPEFDDLMNSHSADDIKQTGAHYTPAPLAQFVARRLVECAELQSSGDSAIRILDPACGDGQLLEAVAAELPAHLPAELAGVDTNEQAVAETRRRLDKFEQFSSSVQTADFLQLVVDGGLAPPDLIIANPPYVRTQVLGADRTEALAEKFGLKGRLDLYQAFVVAMVSLLGDGATLATITSNKLLTTRGAGSVRELLLDKLELLELYDLGDTRLFDAAVLPAVMVARKHSQQPRSTRTKLLEGRFVRAYETDCSGGSTELSSRQKLFEVDSSGHYRIDDASFTVTSGALRIPGRRRDPWAILSDEQARWLRSVDEAAPCQLGDICKVRVGIKTNADAVFIRDNWDELPKSHRPEPQLLHPLLTHHAASRWSPAVAADDRPQVLYPHRDANGSCEAVDLDEYPRARRYLEDHGDVLRGRSYLIDAGRNWYEHWVPQRPHRWSKPKIVFPDIHPRLTACYDDKSIVKGSCYWLGADPEILYRLLGLLNSSIIARYHDLAFQNRLYNGRRRYLTQYVSNYPVPPLDSAPMDKIDELVRRLVHEAPDQKQMAEFQLEIDRNVGAAFGL